MKKKTTKKKKIKKDDKAWEKLRPKQKALAEEGLLDGW